MKYFDQQQQPLPPSSPEAPDLIADVETPPVVVGEHVAIRTERHGPATERTRGRHRLGS